MNDLWCNKELAGICTEYEVEIALYGWKVLEDQEAYFINMCFTNDKIDSVPIEMGMN